MHSHLEAEEEYNHCVETPHEVDRQQGSGSDLIGLLLLLGVPSRIGGLVLELLVLQPSLAFVNSQTADSCLRRNADTLPGEGKRTKMAAQW